MKLRKCNVAILFFIAFVFSAVYSQSEPQANIEIPSKGISNTFLSSGMTIKNDADRYVDLLSFKDSKFRNSFFNTNFTSNYFQIGGAKKFGEYYLGGYYTGNLWEGLSGQFVENSNKSEEVLLSSVISSYAGNKTNLATGSAHSLGALFGFNNMGIMVNSFFNFDVDTKKTVSDNAVNPGIKTSETLNAFNNFYNGTLAWSGTFNVNAKNSLKPIVSVGVIYNDNYSIEEVDNITKTLDTNTKEYTKTENLRNSGTTVLASAGLEAVFGKYTNFIQTADINYIFTMPFLEKCRAVSTNFLQDYNKPENNTGSVSSITKEGDIANGHMAELVYSFNYKPFVKFTVGGRAELGILMNYTNLGKIIKTKSTLEKKESLEYYYDFEGNEIAALEDNAQYTKKSIVENKMFATSIVPKFALGIGYDLKPTFTINIGYVAQLPIINIMDRTYKINSLVKYKVDKKEIAEVNDLSGVAYETNKMENTLSLGFTWKMAQYGALDSSLILKSKPSIDALLKAEWNIGFSLSK